MCWKRVSLNESDLFIGAPQRVHVDYDLDIDGRVDVENVWWMDGTELSEAELHYWKDAVEEALQAVVLKLNMDMTEAEETEAVYDKIMEEAD